MLAEKANFPVAFMCRMLNLARSGFYAWLSALPTEKDLEERALVIHLHEAFRESEGTYGSPRLYRELRAQGLKVGRHRIARLMRREGSGHAGGRGLSALRSPETPHRRRIYSAVISR